MKNSILLTILNFSIMLIGNGQKNTSLQNQAPESDMYQIAQNTEVGSKQSTLKLDPSFALGFRFHITQCLMTYIDQSKQPKESIQRNGPEKIKTKFKKTSRRHKVLNYRKRGRHNQMSCCSLHPKKKEK